MYSLCCTCPYCDIERFVSKENREVPPLRYEDVYRLKQERPHLTIEINGGIKTFAETQAHLQHVDGVMIGREAYHNPYLLAELGQLWNLEAPDRFDIMEQMLPYIEQRLAEGAPSLSLHVIF